MSAPHLTTAMHAPSATAAFATLRARGLRVSSARRQLIKALYAADRPVSADELAGDGDVASAYRNLDVLETIGLVRHVHLGHGPGRYLPTGRPGEFVVCEHCGAVRALGPAALDAVRAAVHTAVGYHAHFSHFPLTGLCPTCSDEHSRDGTVSNAGSDGN